MPRDLENLRKWNEKNRERLLEQGRIRRRKNYAKNQIEHPGLEKAITYQWRKDNPDKLYAIVKTYKKNNPEKEAAHNAVEWAVKSGKLNKPKVCSVCHTNKPEAHHEDYSKPLVVVWLCRQCHQLEHKGESFRCRK